MKYKYKISGLNCAHCASKIEKDLNKQEGIENARVNFMTENVTLESEHSIEELTSTVDKIVKTHESKAQIKKV